jgi:hypothetical protein
MRSGIIIIILAFIISEVICGQEYRPMNFIDGIWIEEDFSSLSSHRPSG